MTGSPKLIGLFRRREGSTPEEFRDYYETRHAPFAISLFGDLFASYRRNYVETPDGIDVVTEIVFADRAAMEQMFARSQADPAIREAIANDEAAFMDRSATQLLVIDEHTETSLP